MLPSKGRRFALAPDLFPGIAAASSFAVSDVLAKAVFAAGGDVLTLALVRGLAGLGIVFVWLRLGARVVPVAPRARLIALLLGVLFAVVVFGLFKAIALTTVPIAVLTYFAYPLLTGIGGALFGIERLSLRGMLAAIVAFFGLALTVGAQPQHLSMLGIAWALAAAVSRAGFLLVARVELQAADPRLTTWYSLVSSTAIFAGAAALTMNWQPPQTAPGWIAVAIVSVMTATGILALYVSAGRVGAFRTALVMNLEPLLATLLSVPLLAEGITPLQAAGGAVMLAALVAFQVSR